MFTEVCDAFLFELKKARLRVYLNSAYYIWSSIVFGVNIPQILKFLYF